ncbi:HD-GYP domain-containing protein [uncultured Paraglaciecola sp.]|uniref:HD-GYP domain-containing protein n=1 Tax=uncultured Paraglaciecola sp. TaxID=1765024 RepID=UPI0026361B39|nr:HD-GYP domain-containing protein [uncultured Paraglaciecola sp.]
MLELVNMDALVVGMFVVKVTQQTGKISVTSAGKITTQKAIDELAKKGILQLEIDLTKSTHLKEEEKETNKPDNYVNASGLSYKQQLANSLKLHSQAKSIQARIIKQVSKGKITDLDDVNAITEELVKSAFECSDALGIITMLKESDQYILEHSISCAVLMVMFGRSLEIETNTLRHLGAGALLMDIGMIKMPLLLTQKADDLNEQETQKVQTHVDIALKLLEPFESIDTISLTVIKQHQEKLDGSGYPKGLIGEQISQYGRMAAIVDTYDSLTSTRPYREAYCPADALKKMKNEDLGLDTELVTKFISCIGIYPIGSVIKLASGKLAMVLRLNPQQPSKPVVMVFFNLTTQLDEVTQVDLSKVNDKIESSVSSDEHGLNLSSFLKKTF